MRKFLGTFVIVVTVVFMGGCFLTINSMMGEFHIRDAQLREPSILFLKLEGVIMDGGEFLENLRKYASDDDIKGVLIQVNSPGGVVGPSQEIYSEIKRVRDVLKKPVVVSCLGLAASGAYYAALGSNKIITNPGAMLGSIGVIMEFANLEKLYEWAKIRRFTIKTGQYKDSGAEYREMREDEKLLFQSLANEVLTQFREAVSESRKMPMENVVKYSDGRVFTGETAVKLGFADSVGTLHDAILAIGKLSGQGDDPKLFEPPPKRNNIFEEILAESATRLNIKSSIEDLTRAKLIGQPLFLLPGATL